MSRAGTKSDQGDDYQRLIAIHWLIRLLNPEEQISFIQAQSNGIPGVDEEITVDDVVIVYENNTRRHIQAKKNQSQNRNWSLSDIKNELPKIRDQLESSPQTVVELYSRTPFGDLHSIADASREYPDINAFTRQSGTILKSVLTEVAKLWNRSETDSLQLLRRLEFASPFSFEEFRRQNLMDLKRLVSHAEWAITILESFINSHQAKLNPSTLTITREDAFQKLEQSNVVRTPMRSEAEILALFEKASRIGREWERTVGGMRIVRTELDKVLQLIESGTNTILVTDRPGSGKTCFLLDIADRIEEQDRRYGLLFIKGDRFVRVGNEEDLKGMGLPEDIVGLCSRLSEYRRVIVIIDSLDVLSINREHGALGMFLNLMDRLQSISNLTVVAACRSFDLKYDPLLRDRNWAHKVQLADFDFEKVVLPMLQSWGIHEERVDAELRRLLQLPQNLRLFEAIVNRGGDWNVRTVYELHETYIEEVIRKAQNLGEPALSALCTMADRLLRDRDHLLAPAAFPAGEALRRALISSGALFQDEKGRLGFCHQTLFDTIVVHSSLSRNEDLARFIKTHPQLPFLRPAVRTFVFHLRCRAPKLFPRQVRAVLIDPNIAYHFKRLIAESLSEITPQEDDCHLIGWMFREQADLFRRFFNRLENNDWFIWLTQNWLAMLGPPSDSCDWYTLFAAKLGSWMNSRPAEIVGLWRRALAERWGDQSDLAWRIGLALRNFTRWETEGTPELLETLLGMDKTRRHLMGHAISRYVAVTNQGDDLLWRFIVRDLIPDDITSLNLHQKLNCNSHDFHDESFLKRRLVESTQLLNVAIESLEKWALEAQNYSKLRVKSAFLHDSSWELRHARSDMRHKNALVILLEAIEHALMHHSDLNSPWWQEHEPRLRNAREVTLLYFLVQTYKRNPTNNLDGISALLTNDEVLRYGRIEYEVGELIQASYHLLPFEVQEDIQKRVLQLYKDEDYTKHGTFQRASTNILKYIRWIPCILRLPETQSFVECCEPFFDRALPQPEVYSWSGWIGPPVPIEQFHQLSDSQTLRLLECYKCHNVQGNHPSDINKGGREMVEQCMAQAAASDPMRYVSLIPEIEHLQIGYLTSLLRGVADHLRYRFGRLRPPDGWQPKSSPKGLYLANLLLNLLERIHLVRQDGHLTSRLLEACCETVEDRETAERLVFLLFRLLRHPDPEEDRQKIFRAGKQQMTSEDLRDDAINSVRGVAAGSAMSLCNKLLEMGIQPPDLTFPLLRHFALDPTKSVRAALFDGLPYLTFKRHEWGWQVFRDIFRETQVHLWPLAELHLYHQYQSHFSLVAPYLERMLFEAPQEAGSAWGRLSALAVLAGHMDQDELFAEMRNMSSSSALKGAAQVFVANLDRPANHALCIECLRKVLREDGLDKSTLNVILAGFAPSKQGRYLDRELALEFLKAAPPDDDGYDLYQLFDWIADLSSHNPIYALDVCEHVFEKLKASGSRQRLWHTEPLISALSGILREADESDNEDLIRRAVRLQDQFLEIDIEGIEDFFDNTTRV